MNGVSLAVESETTTTSASADGTKGSKTAVGRMRRFRDALPWGCFLLLSVLCVLCYVSVVWLPQPPTATLPNAGSRQRFVRQLFSTEATAVRDTQQPQPNCTLRSIERFPADGLTRSQRQHGYILLHLAVALYCFWLLAAICDDYFVPAIEQICTSLAWPKDVAAATFMAAATSSPDLFMNCVGTFLTGGDMGVGTIVGSAVFNILAVAACCGLFVGSQLRRLDWWPISRDCACYGAAVLALIAVLSDQRVMWYEALLLISGYLLYMAVMFNNERLARQARKLTSLLWRCRAPTPLYRQVNEFTSLMERGSENNNASYGSKCSVAAVTPSEWEMATPWRRASGTALWVFLLRWPITLLLWLTLPDSRRQPGWKYVTLLVAICWIGGISYVVAFLITIIGDTLDMPDSVLGLTILAAGMSVPEVVSSVIVARRGHGSMAICNAIGSNTFDILLGLGVPWFVKAYFLPSKPAEPWLALNSAGLEYATGFLLTSLCCLYLAFVVNKFVLSWPIGVACTIMYVVFLLLAVMLELNVFFPVNLPMCSSP